ncbi:hypothetical protein [Cellulomonas sp. P5_C5]
MRRALSVLSIILGSLALLVGGAVALVVGPDDVATLPPTTLPAAAHVVMTAPDLLAFRDATVRVTATSDGGAVFVGAGNPVDVASYLDGVHRLSITGLGSRGALVGQDRPGELDVPATSPETTTFWQAAASGPGTQALDLELDGSLRTVAALPVGAPGTLTLSVGLALPHAFALAVGVALVGLVLIVLPVVLRRRRARTEDTAGEREPADASGTAAPEPSPVLVEHRAEGHRVTPRPGAAWRALGVGAGIALVASGCAVPTRAEVTDLTPVRVAITADEVGPALASYDERNNAADTLAAQTFDASAWESVDTGALLRLDRYSTLYDQAAGVAPSAGTPMTTTTDVVWAPEFTAYPIWFVTRGSVTVGDDEPEYDQLAVYERATVLDPWRKNAVTYLGKDDATPAPLDAGKASVATEPQLAAVAAASEAIRTFVVTGDPGGLEVVPALQTVRDLVSPPTDGGSVEVTVTPAGDGTDLTGPAGAARAVAVEGGVLAVISYDVSYVRTVEEGYYLTINDATFAQLTGQTGERSSLAIPRVLMVTVEIPDGGTPRVLAASHGIVTS